MEGLGTNWEPVGGFEISFGYVTDESGEKRLETKAYNPRTEARARWEGIARDEVMAWIRDQANKVEREVVREDATGVSSHGLPTDISDEPLELEIVDLTIAAVPSRRPGQNILRATGRLRVYEHYEDSDTAQGFRVEFVLEDLDSNHRQTAAVMHGDIVPHEFSRPIQCDFPIPGAGRYQVKAIVKSRSGALMAESPGPVLRVEPSEPAEPAA